MLKSIQLSLSKIKYSGGSIGDDIRVEVEALGKFLCVDKKIKAGTTAEINREVSRFETDQKLFQAEISIVVIEKDLLFNDIGSTKGNIKIDATITKPQQFVFEIQIRETRSILDKFWGTKTAVFEITLEAKVSDAIQCVPNEGDGWLKVVLKNNKSKISLPAFLQVKIQNSDRKREYFTILEGPYRGERASVKLRDDNLSQFISGIKIKYESAISAEYSIFQKIFIINGKKYKADDYPGSPWKKGIYDIEIPDYPHRGGDRYLDRARLARIWFRIGHNGERYLHTGSISLGCMTITEVEKWDALCEILLRARKGDFTSIGVLKVID